jgi:TonB family protein
MSEELSEKVLFGSEINPPVPWRNYTTSIVIHVIAVVLLLLIPIAVIKQIDEKPITTVTMLVAPQLKPYRPERPKIRAPRLMTKNAIPAPKPPAIKPPEIKHELPPAPVVKEVPVPKPVPQPQVAVAEPKPAVRAPEIAAAPAPKPQVHTGLFGGAETAKKVEAPRQVAVGGFGDPNGVHASPDTKAPTLMAKIGSFEMPVGEGNGGGRGGRGMIRQTSFGTAEGGAGGGSGSGRGVVRQSGFGSSEGGSGNGPGRSGAAVRTGGFGETAVGAPTQTIQRPAAPVMTPVEIISKPKPIYTQEARDLRIEGEVSLEVIFSAKGSIQVLRVIQGLGHGLDQSALQAASQIRFRPGSQDGVPVDTRATIHIVFQLT